MHSKRRYKICIGSVILGELESFRNYSFIFAEILDAKPYFESENFSDSSFHPSPSLHFRESSFNMTRRGGDEDIETRSLKF